MLKNIFARLANIIVCVPPLLVLCWIFLILTVRFSDHAVLMARANDIQFLLFFPDLFLCTEIGRAHV